MDLERVALGCHVSEDSDVEKYAHEGWREKFGLFVINTRINRVKFTLLLVFWSIVGGAFLNLAGYYDPATHMSGPTTFVMKAGGVGSIIVSFNLIFLFFRRLRDLGVKALWIFASFIPGVNIIFLILLVVGKGDKGENEYGFPVSAANFKYGALIFSLTCLVFLIAGIWDAISLAAV